MVEFKFLRETIQLEGNVDMRYFDEADGGYKCKPILIKTIADDAVEYFKEQILKLDTRNEYSEVKTKMVEDEEATKENKAQWKYELADLNKKWEEYKKKVLEDPKQKEFVMEWASDGSLKSEAHRIISSFMPEISDLDVHRAVAAWKAAKELADMYGTKGEEYDNLPKYSKWVSTKEFEEEHKALRAKWREELGLPPSDTDFKVTVEEDVRTLFRSNNAIIKGVSPEIKPVEEFAQQLIEELNRQ